MHPEFPTCSNGGGPCRQNYKFSERNCNKGGHPEQFRNSTIQDPGDPWITLLSLDPLFRAILGFFLARKFCKFFGFFGFSFWFGIPLPSCHFVVAEVASGASSVSLRGQPEKNITF